MISEKNFDFGRSNIFYRVAGKGSPVVLLHGFAKDGNVWKYQVEYLKKYFQLIVPDIPCSGKSKMLSNNSTIQDYARVLKAILEKGQAQGYQIHGQA